VFNTREYSADVIRKKSVDSLKSHAHGSISELMAQTPEIEVKSIRHAGRHAETHQIFTPLNAPIIRTGKKILGTDDNIVLGNDYSKKQRTPNIKPSRYIVILF
jgi:hypothetical protein